MKINSLNPTELPNNLFAEQAILNILFLHPTFLDKIKNFFKKEVFYQLSHQIIYQTMIELTEKNYSITMINLLSSFQEKGILEQIGGVDTIGEILNKNQNVYDFDLYLTLLNEKYLRRVIINFGKEIVTSGFSTTNNIDRIFEDIEKKIFYLNKEKIVDKIYSSAEIIDEIFSEIQLKISKNENVGFQTSFKDLDTILQGIQKSDLIIIAGRPSMGKTAFALNLGKNIIEKYQIPLIIFTLEMSRQQIIYRFLSREANINSNRLKSGKMTQIEWKKLTLCMTKISELPIFIDDNPAITLTDIRNKLKKIITTKKKDGVIIIDYLQLMRISLKLENRSQEISYLTRNLKILAREFEVPIILLSQLSRNVESRINKRPLLSDLRESGCKAKLNSLNSPSLITWNKNFFYQANLTISPFLKGIKPTFIITLKNSICFSLTGNHKILTKIGWVSVEELSKNSCLFFTSYQKNNKKIGYESIKMIKYQGLNSVYDKTVPFFHNYVEEGIVFHNSIEQDADVVIMIYREEYYNENSSKPQLTELIVAKHRNGALGTAKLMFTPLITAYDNLN